MSRRIGVFWDPEQDRDRTAVYKDVPTSDAEERSFEYMRRQRTTWVVAVVVMLSLGTTGSILAAGAVARSSAQRWLQVFAASSADIASILMLSIQHEQDLIVSAAGFVISDPGATELAFVRWADSVRALERYPELNGFGESVMVPNSQLKAFAAQAIADPSAPLSPGGTFQVIPPGKRAFYCFSQVGQNRLE